MASVEENAKGCGFMKGATLLEEMKLLGELQGQSGVRKSLNSELWNACAGPLVSLPQVGSLVYYFPQGHSEQVAVSTKKAANSHIPNYPNLPSQLMCQVHNVTLHADRDTDEIYAQMTLQPVNSEKDVLSIPGFEFRQSKQPSDFFCKTLTASDTSTHGGFSVPRRAAEKLFPSLDYSMQPPTQELVVRDLHDNSWTFRHIYRGQPKRHLLTTGWSLFVGAKRLRAGDSVLFIRDEKSQLLLGVRRANRQLTALPSSVLSADSMHIGVLAAAAHAAANRSPFTVFYNPRACPSEFVIPLGKYQNAVYGTQVSIGMRFGMMFETEESGKRRYMGTVVGISDLDPLKWPSSRWRNIQVEWDEPGFGERQNRVNVWEIETPENPFICPSPISSLKRPFHPGFLGMGVETGWENMLRRTLSQVSENGNGDLQYSPIPNLGSEFVKSILKPQLSSASVFGRLQQNDAAIIQNLTSNELSRFPSSVPSCFMNGTLKQHEDTTFQTSVQRNIQLLHAQQQLPPLQNVLIQNLNVQNCLEQTQIVGSNLASHNHKRPHEQITEEPMIEQISRGPQDKLNEHKMDDVVNRNEKSFQQKVRVDKSEMAHEPETDQLLEHSKHILSPPLPQLHTEVIGSPLNTQNLPNHLFLNQSSPFESLMGSQLVQQQLEANTAQPQRTDTSLLDANNLNSFLMFSGHISAQHSETGDWMFHPSSYQSPTSILKSPRPRSGSGKLDTHAPAPVSSDDAENVSSVVNVEAYSPSKNAQFPCISNAHVSQCLPTLYQELSGPQQLTYLKTPSMEHNPGIQPSRFHAISGEQDTALLRSISNSCGLRDFSEESNSQSEAYSSFHLEASNASTMVDPSVSSTCLEGFGILKDGGFHNPPEGLVGNFCSSQDVQSQVTSASLANSQSFPFQEFPDNSGGTSSSNLDVDENSFLHNGSWQQVSPPLRTYTKVQKLGSVGRSIDVTRFKGYDELKSAIACMFGLEGQLDDPRGSGWKLVYVDYENDVLLVGDDPWEEFVSCVRCIRILSPSEVQQMSQEGTQINKVMIQGSNSSIPEDANDWDGP